MRPLVRSYGDNSSVTRSPARTRIRLRRSLPARWARTVRSWSSCTLNNPLGNFSTTVPVTSMLSSLLIVLAGKDLLGILSERRREAEDRRELRRRYSPPASLPCRALHLALMSGQNSL